MSLIDIHAHLDLFGKKLDKVISRAKKAGVKRIITSGLNPKTNRKALLLSEKYTLVKPALGIYPQDSTKLTKSQIKSELEFIENQAEKVVAIGEIGLDKTYQNFDTQKKVFSQQLELAAKLDKPVIVHSRKAEKQVIKSLDSANQKKVVLHCFCGKLKLVKKARDFGFFFSVPANITRSQQFQLLVKTVPLDQLLTETDSPYLSPFKNKTNEPAFVKESVKKIAEIKNKTLPETCEKLINNYNLFQDNIRKI